MLKSSLPLVDFSLRRPLALIDIQTVAQGGKQTDNWTVLLGQLELLVNVFINTVKWQWVSEYGEIKMEGGCMYDKGASREASRLILH